MEEQTQSIKQNSFEISKTSTGKISWTAKIYGDTNEEIETKIKDAINKIQAIEKTMQVN